MTTRITKTTPKALRELFWPDANKARDYVLSQLKFFDGIQNKAWAYDDIAWIALKLSCSRSAAATCIKWAKDGKEYDD